MSNLLPGIIVAFRESLEAFLILLLILEFLEKTENRRLRLGVFSGLLASIILSLALGFLFKIMGQELESVDRLSQIWESLAGLVAVGLITSFIVWMIKHGPGIKQHVEQKMAANLSNWKIFLVSFLLISREGFEITVFAFAGQYNYMAIILGVVLALLLALSLYLSLFRISIATIFQITMVYLIIQAGYLLGHGLHEGLAALNDMGVIGSQNILLIKPFDLSNTIFNNQTGPIGLPLNILAGWYAKPEWFTFLAQYIFTVILLIYWSKNIKNKLSNNQYE